MINFRNPYWNDYTKASWLQRFIAVHSFLYYRADKSIIADDVYDKVCVQLKEMQENMSEEEIREKTTFGYAYYDFDGSTGFDIIPRLKEEHRKIVEIIAANCLKYYNETKGG